MKLVLSLVAVQVFAQQDVNFYSTEKEKALGRQCAGEVRKHSQPLADPGITAFVNRIGEELVGQLKTRRFDCTFATIQSAEWTEPLALPGGYIFVPVRAFIAAQSEAEFAALLAHAIGHVELRHGTRMATRGQVENMSSIPLIFIGGWTGVHSQTGANVLVPAGFQKMQREYELEADRFGVELAARAGHSSEEEFRRVQETIRRLLETTREQRVPTLKR